jgi:hypothetical protein
MHRYVCIWQYILQNYNFKLQGAPPEAGHAQHRLSNLCGHKKDEELKDTDKDKKITMVLSTQQSNEKFSRFVLQQ